MKRIFLSLLSLAMICLFSAEASAQAIKVGVIDMQRFQRNSKLFQQTQAQMKKKFDGMQQKLDEQKNAIVKLEDDLRKQGMMLSLDAQEEKRRDLEKKRRQFKFQQEDYTQEIKDAEIEAIQKIVKELEKIVKKIGENEKYTLILEKRALGLLYYNETIDITDRVTQAYDTLK